MVQSSLKKDHFPLLSFAFMKELVPKPNGKLYTRFDPSLEHFLLFFEEDYFTDFFYAWDIATNNGGRITVAPQSELLLWKVLTNIIENLVTDEKGTVNININRSSLEVYS